MTSKDYNRVITAREREIKRVIAKAVFEAVEALLDGDAQGGDKLGVKYLTRPTLNPGSNQQQDRTIKAGFRDGIGIEINISTAYKPEVTS